MLVSPLMFFPLFYVVLAVAMGYSVAKRWRAGWIHGWQLTLSLLMKLVPIGAFSYAWWWSASTRDDVRAYLMFGTAAVAATVLGVAWVFFDILGLGVWRKDVSGQEPSTSQESSKKPSPKPKPKTKPKPKPKVRR